MSKPKGAAKAAPAKKRARAKKVKTQVTPVEREKDWPPGITKAKAEALFELIEGGEHTVKSASTELGLKGNTVYQWKRRFERFGERLDLAIDIGIDMMADNEIEIADTAKDRETAAAAKERREARSSYRKIKRPERFNVNPFKPSGGEGDGMTIVGVVVVPAKSDMAGLPPQRHVIEGQSREVKRLPIDAPPAAAFKVIAGE